jgi:hypothetical protein
LRFLLIEHFLFGKCSTFCNFSIFSSSRA